MALFGEKYGEKVRVVVFDKDFSVELCGGTHVLATGQIGLFRIISEGAIAAGIRRIEAITEAKALEYYTAHMEILEEAKELLKNPKDILKGIRTILEENQQFKKQLNEFGKGKLIEVKEDLIKNAQLVNGIHFITKKVELDNDSIKDLAFDLKNSVDNLFLVLASENDGKANLTVVISENLVKERGMNAGTIIRELAKEIGGGGGGQPHIATAGGKNPDGIDKALEKSKSFLK
jgi:alanyl-tRNA synthetase